MILNFYLMYFCRKVQPSMTPTGTTVLTHCDREKRNSSHAVCQAALESLKFIARYVWGAHQVLTGFLREDARLPDKFQRTN